MAQVEFEYKGITTTINCKEDEKMVDICNNFINQSKLKENDSNFLYDVRIGTQFNNNLTFKQLANESKEENKKLVIFVNDNREKICDNSKSKSKNIICPECNENIKIDIKNNGINLFGCKNNHMINNISLNEFEKTQMINLNEIKCGICKEKSKANSENNEFYKCY